MSSDQQASRDKREPVKHGASDAELMSNYLDWVRGEVVECVLGMHADERRRSLVPSGWTPLELLSHVMHMEQRWFVWGFLGEAVSDPWGEWNVDEPWTDDSDEVRPDARWTVPDPITAERLAGRVEAIAERSREILHTHPLNAVAASGGRFSANPPTLQWICLHVLAEYARHAGHLDIVAELGSSTD